MSRLDSAIRRLQAQRLCLNAAVAYVEELPGPVLELGLGNGRTYDGLGDPPAARECLEICKYFIDNGIKLILSSNGGLRREDWWRKLGDLFSHNSSFVEFHIGVLADTNHLYRVNTRFSKIMANPRAFLDTGATGECTLFPSNTINTNSRRP